jgi:hypothetical protein
MHRTKVTRLSPVRRSLAVLVSWAFTLFSLTPILTPATAEATPRPAAPGTLNNAGQCALNSASSQIQHVIYIQFDNLHFTRDNLDVPSDLEQMPHLLNFLKNNGSFLANHHTPLISHTADDIITSLTGVYPERHGQAVSNSFNYFNPNSSDKLGSTFTTSFTYWTDIVDPSTPSADSTFSLLTQQGKNAPAPWVPFARAGCNVGAVSIANMELENVGNDINNVFGPNSPEAAEAKASRSQATADFVGIAIHCAAGNPVCASGQQDILPEEPGGYTGYNALFGHKFVAPVISPGTPFLDLNGKPINGFPGFGGISAAQSLAYTAAMQENGVPVTYSYISDAHDNHSFPFNTFGPGEAGYVAQLAAYDDAFNKFFTRLANRGITSANTLFIVTADEGDHYAGSGPNNPGCNGVTAPCTYTIGTYGEIDSNIQSLLGKEDPTLNFTNTPFDIHFDMAPAFYISGQPATGSPIARQFELDASKLTVVNPITGNTDKLSLYLADPVELKLEHMITGDPLRTPTFVMFGDGNYYFQTFGPDAIVSTTSKTVNLPGFAWNHGGALPEITTTFLGLVGPGVKNLGIEDDIWSDHTDIRPTLLSLVGLQDDYQSQGRVLAETLHDWVLPESIRDSGDEFVELARAYKRITAPVGPLGLSSLQVSTAALAGDANQYTILEDQLSLITDIRNQIADTMLQRLTDAEFHGKAIHHGEAELLVFEANTLLHYLDFLAAQQH